MKNNKLNESHNHSKMWDRLLTIHAFVYMKNIKVDGETVEDEESIVNLFKYLREKIDYKYIVVLATKWSKYDELKMVNVAIQIVGVLHASRFCMLMDFLANRFKKGELL
ncbi:hypothetical protein Q7A53_05920 [Halobacillus rhizosphaerae]|uniref:hypothetical protein n=1 Tax=Halobacillus rhizosphaerae TaxID=3064889 RepID=UPI00398AA9AF